MKIAIPSHDEKLCLHFGHCEVFVIVDVDERNTILRMENKVPPPHEPGLLPKWLREMGVDVVIAGGMGQRAQNLFAENSIKVVVGAPPETLKTIIEKFLNGTLETGANTCDH